MRRRGLAVLAMLLLAFSLIAGCSGGTSPAGAPAEETTRAALELMETTAGAGETAADAAETMADAAETEDPDSDYAAEDDIADDGGYEAAETEDAAAAEEQLTSGETEAPETAAAETEAALDENGEYNSKEEVALYIHLYGHLPDNYITKKEAENLGWSGGSLERYAPGKSIGGSRFGNYEGLLPEKKGRKYTECDIDTQGRKSRGAKRIVFSNDGLVYYTEDHYESFELLYGEE